MKHDSKTPVITDLSLGELEALLASFGEPAYRARQISTWVYRKLAVSYDEMTDLPAELRRRLMALARLHSLEPAGEMTSRDGTVKALFRLADGLTVEAAMMPYPERGGGKRCTVCVSTQVGCSVGCPFCATGRQGFQRNLSTGEIVDQVLYFARYLKYREQAEKPWRLGNIVFMGMGEPLANYDALRRALGLLNSPEGFGLGARSMTISTAGLVPGIERLGREGLQVGLAVSLHAAENTLRDRLVPLNRKYPLEVLLAACQRYFLATGRRVSFEYVLFKGINDSPAQAYLLAERLQGLVCHINLIAANDCGDAAFQPPTPEGILEFVRVLKKCGMNVTLRRPRGRDIAAGCGQLRSRLGMVSPDKPGEQEGRKKSTSHVR